MNLTSSNDSSPCTVESRGCLSVVLSIAGTLFSDVSISNVVSTLQECVDHIYICLHTTVSHVYLLLVMVCLTHLYIIIETTHDIKL